MRIRAAIILLSASYLAAASLRAYQDQPTRTVWEGVYSEAQGQRGEAAYTENCAKCHGKTATGRHFGGPSLVSDKVAAASPDDLRTMISNGKGRMLKYASKLTDEEIDTLVKQIEGMNKK